MSMPDILVCKKGEMADGDTRLFQAGTVEIGVISYREKYYAYQNLCPHQGGPVCEGQKVPQVVENIGEQGVHLGMTFDEDDLHIVCPWHGWEFHLEDGCHVIEKRKRLRKFPIIERDGNIYVIV
jgi:nitrite reductase (NADH) small subunit